MYSTNPEPTLTIAQSPRRFSRRILSSVPFVLAGVFCLSLGLYFTALYGNPAESAPVTAAPKGSASMNGSVSVKKSVYFARFVGFAAANSKILATAVAGLLLLTILAAILIIVKLRSEATNEEQAGVPLLELEEPFWKKNLAAIIVSLVVAVSLCVFFFLVLPCIKKKFPNSTPGNFNNEKNKVDSKYYSEYFNSVIGGNDQDTVLTKEEKEDDLLELTDQRVTEMIMTNADVVLWKRFFFDFIRFHETQISFLEALITTLNTEKFSKQLPPSVENIFRAHYGIPHMNLCNAEKAEMCRMAREIWREKGFANTRIDMIAENANFAVVAHMLDVDFPNSPKYVLKPILEAMGPTTLSSFMKAHLSNEQILSLHRLLKRDTNKAATEDRFLGPRTFSPNDVSLERYKDYFTACSCVPSSYTILDNRDQIIDELQYKITTLVINRFTAPWQRFIRNLVRDFPDDLKMLNGIIMALAGDKFNGSAPDSIDNAFFALYGIRIRIICAADPSVVQKTLLALNEEKLSGVKKAQNTTEMNLLLVAYMLTQDLANSPNTVLRPIFTCVGPQPLMTTLQNLSNSDIFALNLPTSTESVI